MDKLIDYAPLLARGAVVTVSVALLSLLFATMLGALGAAAKLSGRRLWSGVAAVYTTIVRGVPDLVMILLIYFGGQRLINDIMRLVGAETVDISKYWAGVFAISFIYGAYLTETFRGAYLTVPKGQAEAAQALGLKRTPTQLRVILPQLMRFALPGYSNVWLVLVKSTAVVSVIGLQDLVGIADKAGKSTREPFLFLLAVMAVYLAITATSNWFFRRADVFANRGMTA